MYVAKSWVIVLIILMHVRIVCIYRCVCMCVCVFTYTCDFYKWEFQMNFRSSRVLCPTPPDEFVEIPSDSCALELNFCSLLLCWGKNVTCIQIYFCGGFDYYTPTWSVVEIFTFFSPLFPFCSLMELYFSFLSVMLQGVQLEEENLKGTRTMCM